MSNKFCSSNNDYYLADSEFMFYIKQHNESIDLPKKNLEKKCYYCGENDTINIPCATKRLLLVNEDNIEHISLNRIVKSINHLMIFGCMPKSLILSKTIESLTYYDSIDNNAENEILIPNGIKKLYIFTEKNKKLIIPNSVYHLEITGVLPFPLIIPKTVKSLKIGGKRKIIEFFNNYSYDKYHLFSIFGRFYTDRSCINKPLMIPNSIKYLSIGTKDHNIKFNYPLVIPKHLKKLDLYCTFNRRIHLSNLTNLHIEDYFDKKIILPESLKSLSLEATFYKKISLPKQLNELNFNVSNSSSFNPCILKFSNKIKLTKNINVNIGKFYSVFSRIRIISENCDKICKKKITIDDIVKKILNNSLYTDIIKL